MTVFDKCEYHYDNPQYFEGCPGLDVFGDNDECGDCPYRLGNIRTCLQIVKLLGESFQGVPL